MRSAAEETRPINHISFALNERIKQRGVVLRIIFEVRILNNYEIARCLLYPAPKRGTFAHIVRLQKHSHIRMLVPCTQDFPRTVTRAIIHTQQLDIEWNREHASYYSRQRVTLIVNWYHYRQFHDVSRNLLFDSKTAGILHLFRLLATWEEIFIWITSRFEYQSETHCGSE